MHLELLQPSSDNFNYQFDADLPGADVRAAALQASCESDLARLEQPLFGVSGGFGPGNRVTVSVESTPGLAGNNGGYGTEVPMTIVLNFDVGPDATRRTRSAFVNEMAEILMDYRNRVAGSISWVKNHSDGEGLSRVCGAELYHGLGVDDGLNAWVYQNPRNYQWIDASDPTDQNWPSWGISILFINYLRSQLGFPLSRIIQGAGRSLAETYHKLTGRQDARQAFHDLIERFIPAGQVDSLDRDNPFPFLEPQRRSVSLSISSAITEGPELPGLGGSAVISPGWICPKDTYSYTIHGDTETALITATAHGFARPLFRWTIAGIEPPQPDPEDGSVTINPTVSVGEEHPETPGRYSWTTQTAALDYEREVSALFSSSAAQVKNLDHPGLEQFPVTVEVVDEYAYPDLATATTTSDYITLAARSIRWEPRYEADKQRCEEQERDFIRRHTRFRELIILLTLPDPAPTLSISTVIGKLIYEVGRLARELPEEGHAVAETIGRLLGVSGSQLLEGQFVIPTPEIER